MPTITDTYYVEELILTEAAAVAAVLHGAKVGLFQSPFVATRQSTYADITAPGLLPTYTGYAVSGALVWSAPFLGADGLLWIDGGDVLFQPTDGATPNDIFGWFLFQPTGNHLLLVWRFDNPVTLDSAATGVIADVVWKYNPWAA